MIASFTVLCIHNVFELTTQDQIRKCKIRFLYFVRQYEILKWLHCRLKFDLEMES